MSHRRNNAPQYRFRGQVSPQEAQEQGARAESLATSDGDTAVLRLYDVLDSWGGFWGISANEFLTALDEVGGNIKSIELHINSPGGEATEGVALYNALVNHSARVDVIIDGIAASAASIVAMAGDTVTMSSGTEMMVHEAWMGCIGNAEDMTKTADLLTHMNDNLASVYMERAGGSITSWKKAMADETWYNPDEALAAGLATAVNKKRSRNDASASARFDLSVFNFAGRENAPDPRLDSNTRSTRANLRSSSTHGREKNRMTPEQLQALGLDENATDEQISARIEQLVKNEAEIEKDPDTPPAGTGDEPTEPATTPSEPAEPVTPPTPTEGEVEQPQASYEPPKGTVLVDAAQHAQLQTLIKEHDQLKAQARRKERDELIKSAMKDGKFGPAQQKQYEAVYDANPEAAKALIGSLAKNIVPLDELGHGGNTDQIEDDSYPTLALSAQEKTAIARARQGA